MHTIPLGQSMFQHGSSTHSPSTQISQKSSHPTPQHGPGLPGSHSPSKQVIPAGQSTPSHGSLVHSPS